MTEPKRYKVKTDCHNQTFDSIEDPEGQWIFDPDHKIDLCNLTSHSSRAAKACAESKSCLNAKAGCSIPCLWHKPPPA